jgi:hypothetical protein
MPCAAVAAVGLAVFVRTAQPAPHKSDPLAARWNFTPSPGWTKEEVQILRLCVMKHGVGAWGQIAASGQLAGKTSQQLSSQTQRLLGQQSLAGARACPRPSAHADSAGPNLWAAADAALVVHAALEPEAAAPRLAPPTAHCPPLHSSCSAFTGLKVHVDRVRRDNEARPDAQRKAGLIIRSGRERGRLSGRDARPRRAARSSSSGIVFSHPADLSHPPHCGPLEPQPTLQRR